MSEDKDYGSLRSQSVATELPCRVYWGSHGCDLPRGHDGEHVCSCSFAEDGSLLPHIDDPAADEDNGNVGRAPYYGQNTRFFGEEAEALGLPLVE